MINNDSIVTAYDEHLTLVEWLQKIEKLLSNGGVKDVTVNEVEDGFQFVIIYNDNTTMTSNTFKLGDVSVLIDSINAIKNGRTHLFETITDKDDNLRFIEGDITMNTIDGVIQTYGKWSLSGTHLMIVVCGSVTNESVIRLGTNVGYVKIPNWVYDKITPLFGTFVIERKSIPAYASNWSTQNIDIYLRNQNGSGHEKELLIKVGTDITFTSDRSFRIQFDLLIDNE